LFISAPVAVQSFTPKQEFAASIARIQINTVHQSSVNCRIVKKAMRNKTVSLVERMLELHKQSAVVRSPLDKERVGREIESMDKYIDRLVYELYGLSEDDVKVVKGVD